MSRAVFIQNRAASKREAILAAARNRFSTDGYARSSTESIARDAQVSTATLYRQFPTKLDLFASVLSDGIGDFEGRLRAMKAQDPRDRFRELAHAYGELLDQPDTAGVMRAILSAASTSPEVAHVFYERIKAVVAGAFYAAVIDLSNDGQLALPPDPAVPVGQLMGMIEHATLWRRMLSTHDAKVAVANMVDDAIETFWARWEYSGNDATRRLSAE
jgi:TetR/AcrR family transcriptional regulator, regulator of autoinduction and epiphytic fitness